MKFAFDVRTQPTYSHSLHDVGNGQHNLVVKEWKVFVLFGYQHHEGREKQRKPVQAGITSCLLLHKLDCYPPQKKKIKTF